MDWILHIVSLSTDLGCLVILSKKSVTSWWRMHEVTNLEP